MLDLEGIEDVGVDFATGTAYLISSDGTSVDTEAAIEALKGANYGASLKDAP